MSEITEHLEKLCKDLHDYVAKNFQSDLHEVRIAEIKFETKPKLVSEALDLTPLQPMKCTMNSQGQVVCTP